MMDIANALRASGPMPSLRSAPRQRAGRTSCRIIPAYCSASRSLSRCCLRLLCQRQPSDGATGANTTSKIVTSAMVAGEGCRWPSGLAPQPFWEVRCCIPRRRSMPPRRRPTTRHRLSTTRRRLRCIMRRSRSLIIPRRATTHHRATIDERLRHRHPGVVRTPGRSVAPRGGELRQ